ncbi:hypothetical protein [Peribacillus butanolivorans]|uniref:hypothetical protein n=1 Tax=Peribacillus butanolivorans TaxID=421767 RepID=UPI0036735C36
MSVAEKVNTYSENKKRDLKDFDFVVVLAVIFAIIFFSISILLITFTTTEWKDMYTTFFSVFGSIVGGLLGGYITLLGVQRTVWAQREQESVKLIPQKLIKIHSLDKEIRVFRLDFNTYLLKLNSIEQHKSKSKEELSRYINEGFLDLIRFRSELSNRELKFIEIVSYIDIDIYNQIKSIFDDFEVELDAVESHYPNTLIFQEEEEEKYIDTIIDDIEGLTSWGLNRIDEIQRIIPLKLQQYQKEIL